MRRSSRRHHHHHHHTAAAPVPESSLRRELTTAHTSTASKPANLSVRRRPGTATSVPSRSKSKSLNEDEESDSREEPSRASSSESDESFEQHSTAAMHPHTMTEFCQHHQTFHRAAPEDIVTPAKFAPLGLAPSKKMDPKRATPIPSPTAQSATPLPAPPQIEPVRPPAAVASPPLQVVSVAPPPPPPPSSASPPSPAFPPSLPSASPAPPHPPSKAPQPMPMSAPVPALLTITELAPGHPRAQTGGLCLEHNRKQYFIRNGSTPPPPPPPPPAAPSPGPVLYQLPVPIVKELSQISGRAGDELIVRGSDFIRGAFVLFGASTLTTTIVVSPTEIRCTVPVNRTSNSVVSVRLSNIDFRVSNAISFTYSG